MKALLGKTIAQTSLADATLAALSLIIATEETAKVVTPPYAIGGPIDVATITKTGTTPNPSLNTTDCLIRADTFKTFEIRSFHSNPWQTHFAAFPIMTTETQGSSRLT